MNVWRDSWTYRQTLDVDAHTEKKKEVEQEEKEHMNKSNDESLDQIK